MKIDAVVIKDEKEGVVFGFIKQFPGITAQADSIDEFSRKINTYFHAYINRIKDAEVDIDEKNVKVM